MWCGGGEGVGRGVVGELKKRGALTSLMPRGVDNIGLKYDFLLV